LTGRRRRTVCAATAMASASSLTVLIAIGHTSVLLEPVRLPSSHNLGSTVREKLAGLGTFREIADRPLFSPARRPFVPPPPQTVLAVAQVAPPPPPPEPPASRVLAVVIGPDRRAAVLRLTTGKTAVILEGERVGDWILTSVLPDRAVLTSHATVSTVLFATRPQGHHDSLVWPSPTGLSRRN
jgi:hypothetical protein